MAAFDHSNNGHVPGALWQCSCCFCKLRSDFANFSVFITIKQRRTKLNTVTTEVVTLQYRTFTVLPSTPVLENGTARFSRNVCKYQSKLCNIPGERILHIIVSLTYSRQIDPGQLSRYSDTFRGSNCGRPKTLICSPQRPKRLLDPPNGGFLLGCRATTGVKLTTHLRLVQRVRTNGASPLLSVYTCMAMKTEPVPIIQGSIT